TGLWMYDRFARDPLLPERAVYWADDPRAPPVDLETFRWECAYSDAAIQYPERFVIALLQDAQREATRQGIEFRVLTYHRATFASGSVGAESRGEKAAGAVVEVAPVNDSTSQREPLFLRPSAIVN